VCKAALKLRDPRFILTIPHFSSHRRNILNKPYQQLLLFRRPSDKEWKMSQYTVHNSTEFSNNGNAFDVRNSDTITRDRSQLLAWLSPLNPALRHWEIQERRASDVGEWLIQTEEFRRWCAGCEGGGEGGSAVLFGYGNPGVGKTFIR